MLTEIEQSILDAEDLACELFNQIQAAEEEGDMDLAAELSARWQAALGHVSYLEAERDNA